jgi:putative SOS response-associated peptidase YedK
MCHAYSITTNLEALRALRFTFEVASNIGNLAPQTGVYPDMLAPIIRNEPGGLRELAKLRWGMPSSSRALYLAAKERATKLIQKQGRDISPDEFEEMVRMEPDRGTHNVRNTDSLHWNVSTRLEASLSRQLMPSSVSGSYICTMTPVAVRIRADNPGTAA